MDAITRLNKQHFQDLKEARIKGSLNARITALEKSVGDLCEMVESVCDLLEAHKLVDFSILSEYKWEGNTRTKSVEVDEDTPDEYNRLSHPNYGGTK